VPNLGLFLIAASLLLPPPSLAADYRALARELLQIAAQNSQVKAAGCSVVEDKIAQLELAVVDLKARYWASQMKEGSLPRHVILAKKPGSEIGNPGIRSRFYSQWRYWYEDLHSARLTGAEMAALAASENKIRRLSESCASSFSL